MDSDSGELSDGDLVSAVGKAAVGFSMGPGGGGGHEGKDAGGNRAGSGEKPLFFWLHAALVPIPLREWAVIQKENTLHMLRDLLLDGTA